MFIRAVQNCQEYYQLFFNLKLCFMVSTYMYLDINEQLQEIPQTNTLSLQNTFNKYKIEIDWQVHIL